MIIFSRVSANLLLLVFFVLPGLPRGQFSGAWLFSTAEARTGVFIVQYYYYE